MANGWRCSGDLDVAVAFEDARTVVRFRGDLDVFTAPVALRALAGAEAGLRIGRASGPLVVDLSGVEYVGADGLTVLAGAAKRACRQGERLVLRRPSRGAHRALEVTGLLRSFDVEQEADGDLRAA